MVINAEEFIILLDHAAGRRGAPRQDAADVNVFPLLLLHEQANASKSLSFVCVRASGGNMSTRERKAYNNLCFLEECESDCQSMQSQREEAIPLP